MINSKNITIYGLVSEDEPNNIKYIGITGRRPNHRFNNHLYEAKHNPSRNLRTIWISENNYKIKQIILDNVPQNEASFWEKHWISLVKSWGYNLVNSNNGGSGLLIRSKEFSDWLSKRSKGNTYNLGKTRSEGYKKSITGVNNPAYGKIGGNTGNNASNETKLKQSLAKIGTKGNATGFKHTEETKNKKRKPVIQLDLNGNYIKEWCSGIEAANVLKINNSKITLVCQGNRETTGGFKWKYKN